MARLNSDQADIWRILDVMEVTDALKNKRVVFTGHLGLSRTEISKIVERAGGTVDSNVNYGVNYLVSNQDWNTGSIIGSKSNKFRKAEQCGVKILNEQEFIDLIVSQSSSSE